MNDSKQLTELLHRLKANEVVPDSNHWPVLKKELCEKIESHLQSHKKLNQTLELGYQEMQKMLELFEQRDLLTKSIFDASQDIILTLDDCGQVIEFNRAIEILIKIDGKTIMGQKLASIIPTCSFSNDLNSIFSEPRSINANSIFGKPYECTLFDSEGKALNVLVLMKQIQHKESVIYPVYIKDLTFEKAAALELEENRAQMLLTSKMSALGEMAGGVAHEINTPLAIIQLRADQLIECANEDALDQETLLTALDAIVKTVKRIAKIVSGLRSFSRDGRKDPMMLFPVSKIIDDTLCLCKEKFSSHGVSLDFFIKSEVEVECRPGEITQVLLNMLNNAFDAIEPLSDKWVKIEVEQIQTNVRLRVTDSGPGIPPEIQKKLMQPFFTTKETGKGTGLGLSISKGLIESHSGTLQIDNASKNTCFVISLPTMQRKNVSAA